MGAALGNHWLGQLLAGHMVDAYGVKSAVVLSLLSTCSELTTAPRKGPGKEKFCSSALSGFLEPFNFDFINLFIIIPNF